ncbi:MAG: hypothetical protein MI892_04025, partial [Desulfobacterales bacterium]|nr:hypothetical protein [Desulfobacterales bacterium]
FSYKNIIIVGCVIIAILLSGAILNKKVLVEEASSEPTFLYVQTAHSGTLSAEQADGRRVLTLNDVSPSTVYFSDRPDRITGHEPTEDFIANWNQGEDSFESSPPNAALDLISENSQSLFIVEIMGASYDPQTHTLQYEIIILDNESGGEIPASFGEAALFIDSTHKDFQCKCSLSGKDICTCDFEYHLGRSGTKEFRGYCKGEAKEPKGMKVNGKNKHTTCTIPAYVGYVSKSCTNWNPTSGDDIEIKVECGTRFP